MRRKNITLFCAATLVALALAACGKDEKEPSGNAPDVPDRQEQPTEVTPRLNLSADSVRVAAEGGSQEITVTSTGEWAVVSDQDWCQPEPASGSGDGAFTITVAAETLGKADTAHITVSAGSLTAMVAVLRSANPSAVTDCQGNTYPVVLIGDQYWMAENLRCTQYDTQSERAGATLTTSKGFTFEPYYTDGRESIYEKNDIVYSRNLTAEHRAKLGLLYNWAAAMGYASAAEARAQTGDYDGIRQGICPNGWHMPSQAEWKELSDYVASQDATVGVGKQLKSASGWYDNTDGIGTDAYGFTALPAGRAMGASVYEVGQFASFWISGAKRDEVALGHEMTYNVANLLLFSKDKFNAVSVRCVRD